MADVKNYMVENTAILNDGLKVVIAKPKYGEMFATKISETLAKAIYETITSFDVALTMKRNYLSKPAQQIFIIDDESAEVEDLVSAVFNVCNTSRLDSCTLFVSSSVGGVTIAGEELTKLVNILKDAGADAHPTYGKYTNIKFCIEPPAITVMEDGVVYILSVKYKEFAAGTCFIVTTDEETGERTRNIFNTETGEVEPIAHGNPEDASSYPDSGEEKSEETTGEVGGEEDATVEVFDSEITETATITASENVNVVNVTMTDASVRVNIA